MKKKSACRVLRALILSGAMLGSALAVEARGPWVQWKDCVLLENDSNDGDSFHIKAGGQEYIIRLYLVDAPEADDGFPARVAEQGKYFGISPAQSVQLGALAAQFVEEKLARPFAVRTSRQNAMGRSNAPRYYAFVETSVGDLGELLVANGLARVHGVAPAADSGTLPARRKEKLRALEMEARRQKVGGWGATSGRMKTRLPSAGGRGGLDAFDAFFHPERARAAAASPTVTPGPVRVRAAAVPSRTASRQSGLDPNTATVEELVRLPGIGPVLAGRIVAARPFKSADDLRRVAGIGPKKYAQIRPHFAPGL